MYHFIASGAWTLLYLDSVSQFDPAGILPWLFAAAFLLDIFHVESRSRGAVEEVTYGWISQVIAIREALRLDLLPEMPSLVPEQAYEADLRRAINHTTESSKAPYTVYWRFIWQHHGRELICATLLRLVCDFSLFSIPWQLQGLLANLTSARIMSLFCSRALGALAGNYSGYFLRRLSVRYRSALSTMLHEKTMKLGDAKLTDPVADLATLSEVDTMSLYRTAQTFTDLWIFPFQAILCFVGLGYLLPYQALIAVLALISIMFPVLSTLIRSVSHWIFANMAAKDERAKVISEMLDSIAAIKMHAWEPVLARLVGQRRQQELRALQKKAVWESGLVAYVQSMPSALTVVAFGVLLVLRRPLTNELVFAAIMLFTMLNATLSQLSQLVSVTQQVAASTTRIHRYMALPEGKLDLLDGGKQTQVEQAQDSTFNFLDLTVAWPGASGFVIRNSSLAVARGSLTLIIGSMGCGKSTFMLALARYAQRMGGRTKVAYVGPETVMIDGTVRDNILFGRAYNEQLYSQVVRACCLDLDLARLRDGDSTRVVGSSSLSGGQRARICLARAAYFQADIYVLDDPFSALDVKVSANVTNNLLGPGGLLSQSTRILASSHRFQLGQPDATYRVQDGLLIAVEVDSDLASLESGEMALERPRDEADRVGEDITKVSEECARRYGCRAHLSSHRSR